MSRETGGADGLTAILLGAAVTVLVIVAAPCCFSEDNTTGHDVMGPYDGKTADDVWNEARTASQPGRDGTPVGLPGAEAVVKMLIWVGVVIVFIYTVVYVIRRYVPSARNMFGSGVVKVVGRTYISSKQHLLLVKVGSKFVMVGVTGTSMSPLAEISDPAEAKRLTEELAAQRGPGIASSFKTSLDDADGSYADDDVHGAREAELSGIRQELDAVAQKMTWWRSRGRT